jgi:hypothetical protein
MNGLFLNNLKSAARTFEEEGILFFPQLFPAEQVTRLHDACEFVLEQFREELQRTNPDAARKAVSMRQLHDSKWHQSTREYFQTIMETIVDPRCLGPVEQIFQGRSLFRATSYFFNPLEGNIEGDWHRDQQFMFGSEEKVKEYFDAPQDIRTDRQTGIQLQIALVETEDIEYVPFSASRYDSPQEYYIRCEDNRAHNREGGMPNAMRVHQRPGDAVIFNAAGLHRGRYYADTPRRTLMLTYTSEGTLLHDQFSRQPWTMEPAYLDGLSPRARVYFEEYVAAYQESWTVDSKTSR